MNNKNQNEQPRLVNGFPYMEFKVEKAPSPDDVIDRTSAFYDWINKRRSVREFSDKPVPKSAIENLIKAASTAPSGAHKQPWTFCAVSNKELKAEIREAAESEEKTNYERRMSERWKKDLAMLGTDMHKSFLEDAPWLIVAFKRVYEFDKEGEKRSNYYVNESLGIACGFLITAIFDSGLVTLPYTPSPMNFLEKILSRPKNERAYILFPVGYPNESTWVPQLKRKELEEMAVFYE